MWKRPTDLAEEPWDAVEARLRDARVYWLTTTRRNGQPHPRPMWGIWREGLVLLSAPATQLGHAPSAPLVAVHVDDGSGIAIVEGRAHESRDDSLVDDFVRLYNLKYDYVLERRAPLVVEPVTVLSWTIRGEAARDGFGAGSKWRLHQ